LWLGCFCKFEILASWHRHILVGSLFVVWSFIFSSERPMVGGYWLLNVSPLGLVLSCLVRYVPNRIVLVMNALMMSFLLDAGSAWFWCRWRVPWLKPWWAPSSPLWSSAPLYSPWLCYSLAIKGLEFCLRYLYLSAVSCNFRLSSYVLLSCLSFSWESFA
jgi:hypothetical protein